MAKVLVQHSDYMALTIQRLQQDGLLLVSMGANGKANVMTIGWGTIGVIWGLPIFVVLVRHSRHTFSLMEQVSDFTVNVFPKELETAVKSCGIFSGRDHDKFKDAHLTPIPSHEVHSPTIKECVLHYECRTVNRMDMLPEELALSLRGFYKSGDYHRIYFGEIVATYADEDAIARLSA
jgi:flavin reductase (DIM6/NTAB) family NADH-FMN oxidoreductase RutF